MHQGPFPATAFTVINFYQGPANGTWVLVYAGAVRDPITGATVKGAVRIYTEPDVGGALTEIGTFSPVSAVGAVRIVEVSGSRLVLTSTDGVTLNFDLGSHQFAAS